MTRISLTAAIAAFMLISLPTAFAQVRPELITPHQFRVCADPNDLPFSNRKLQGFENKIAALIARGMNRRLTYFWFPNSAGFVRNSLSQHFCDVIMGVVGGEDMVATTAAYYHSGYVIVRRKGSKLKSAALSDPAFQRARIGIIAGTPPADLLVRYHLLDQIQTYALLVDTRYADPSLRMLKDIANRKIDIGLLWGPIAGYDILHDHLPLTATFIAPSANTARLDYRIAIGVRPGDPLWRNRINLAIEKNRHEITAILESYGVPLLDAQNHPIKASVQLSR